MTQYALKIGPAWVEIVGWFTVGEGEDAIQYPPNWPENATPEELTAVGVVAIEESAVPTDAAVIGNVLTGDDAPVREWLTDPYPLEQAQALMWQRAKAVQAAHALGGCMTPAGRIQTDQDSQRLIQTAISAVLTCNMLGVPFPGVTLTMEDNSREPLDGAQMGAVSMAVVTFFDRCKQAGEAIRDAIYAAETPEAVFAVDIDAGYPAD